jgi:thioredoxin-dependent peroxiredoxin
LLEEFGRLGVQVLGASVDPPVANARFAEKYDLRMPLLCDTERELVQAFGVERPTGRAERVTFLLDANGTIRKTYPKVIAKGHAADVLADCRELWG